jgi:hypothetical protein
MPPAGFELILPATNLPQTFASDRAATGICECGVTSLEVTNLEGMFDSEMNNPIEQRKAIYVHFNKGQLTYLSFVISMPSVSSLHSTSMKFPNWNNMTVVLVSVP